MPSSALSQPNRRWRCSLRVAIVLFLLFIGIRCLFGISCRSAAATAAHRPNLDKAEHACAFEARDLAQQVADKVEGGLDGSVDERAVLLPAHDDAAAGRTQQTPTSREKDRHECVRTDFRPRCAREFEIGSVDEQTQTHSLSVNESGKEFIESIGYV